MKIRLGFVSNSSSESFVISTNKTPEEIRQELQAILDLHNRVKGQSLVFEEVFQEPFMGSTAYDEDMADWEYGIKSQGKIVVESTYDNTIPWGVMEFMERTYDCRRYHLG